ncbi:MAG: hypothetical protein M0R03_08765 [Novosphingobium sp.]|nr:hypothetical protein [Novosphingobium sp.]
MEWFEELRYKMMCDIAIKITKLRTPEDRSKIIWLLNENGYDTILGQDDIYLYKRDKS